MSAPHAAVVRSLYPRSPSCNQAASLPGVRLPAVQGSLRRDPHSLQGVPEPPISAVPPSRVAVADESSFWAPPGSPQPQAAASRPAAAARPPPAAQQPAAGSRPSAPARPPHSAQQEHQRAQQQQQPRQPGGAPGQPGLGSDEVVIPDNVTVRQLAALLGMPSLGLPCVAGFQLAAEPCPQAPCITVDRPARLWTTGGSSLRRWLKMCSLPWYTDTRSCSA